MFNHSSEISILEELIRKNWPNQGSDKATNKDESDWDILNDINTKGDASNRHWFKQNYINQTSQHTSMVTYH